MRPSLALVVACLGALLAAVLLTWPLAFHLLDSAPSSRFTGGHLAALAVALHVPPWSVHTDLAGAPGGADFRPLLWPTIALAHLAGPLVAYNLTILLTPMANVLGGWVLGRRLYGPGTAAVWLGALIGLPPWVRTTLQNGQPEQAILGLGAAILALALWAAEGARWRLFVVSPFVCIAGISAPHVVLATLVLVGVWSLLGARAAPRRLVVLGLAGLGALGVAAYHGPGFDSSLPHFFAPFGLPTAVQSGPVPKREARLVDLFFQAHLPPGRGPWVVHLAYLGPALAAAAVAGARRQTWAFVAGCACVILAFGDSGPFRLLGELSATLAASGTPYRFMAGAVLALCIVVAGSRWAPLVLAISLVETVLVDPRGLPMEREPVAMDPEVDLPGTGTILDLPLPARSCREGAAHYLYETGLRGRQSPYLLRAAEEAWGGHAEQGAALLSAFEAVDCPARLSPLLTPFDAVVLHDHPGCPLPEGELLCLTAVLGTPRVQGPLRYWSTAK